MKATEEFDEEIFEPLEQKSFDLLIGLRYLRLFPKDLDMHDNLKIQSSRYGREYVISGAHPSIYHESSKDDEFCHLYDSVLQSNDQAARNIWSDRT